MGVLQTWFGRDKRRGRVDAKSRGNQGVEGLQITLGGLRLDYGETVEIKIRVYLHHGGWLEAEEIK